MSFLLVTNDDGIDSPALVPLMEALAPLGPVRAVVPDRERSWIGKAITRFEDVRVERDDREGHEIWKATGFPADCAQIGIHALFDAKPWAILSGINVGFNHGLAFLCSSGTVGAATEGWIAGIPALAVSVGVLEDHATWSLEAREPEARRDWERCGALAAEITADVCKHGLPRHADLLSVNFPWGTGPESPRRITRLARVGYDRMFQRREAGVFYHEFGGMVRREQSLSGSDLAAARDGTVSITPVRLPHTADVSENERAVFER